MHSSFSRTCMFAQSPISLHSKKSLFFAFIPVPGTYSLPFIARCGDLKDRANFHFIHPLSLSTKEEAKDKKNRMYYTTIAIFQLSGKYGKWVSSYFVSCDNADVEDAVSFWGDACSADDAFAPPVPLPFGLCGSESSSWKPRFLKLSLPINPLIPLAKGKRCTKEELEYKKRKKNTGIS